MVCQVLIPSFVIFVQIFWQHRNFVTFLRVFTKIFMMSSLCRKCFDVIISEFDRYHLAYQLSDDATLKRSFEFLRRAYPNELADELFDKDKRIACQYVDFVINRHLTMMDTSWLSECSWETIAAKFAEIGSNLVDITNVLHDGRPWKDIICHLPNLVEANFERNCNDEILKGIGQFCPDIEKINASHSSAVTDTGLQYLYMKENGKLCCPLLTKVYIKGSGVTEAGVAHLIKNLPLLEETLYTGLPEVLYSLHKNDLSRLDEIEPYNITSLNFYDLYKKSFFTDILNICLSLCPFLVSVSCRMLTGDHLDLFDSLNELEKLDLEFSSRSSFPNINDLIKLKGRKLTSLSVQNCSLSLSDLAKSCPCLTSLQLTFVKFQDNSDISPVSKRAKICGVIIDETVESSELEEIRFTHCNFSSAFKAEFLIFFERFPVKKIHIFYSQVEIKVLKDILENCNSLEDVSLFKCNLDGERKELCDFAKELEERHVLIFFRDLLYNSETY